jgi:hypothetical protein
MRARHPARLIARFVCLFLEVPKVDFDALDAYLDEVAEQNP